ncbi:MAG: molybdopterin-dependent oxidoreductase [Anaerolineae bacterium]|nr:molybdopterin-dependent oxidoreductase [Anaerolineae bacterium]
MTTLQLTINGKPITHDIDESRTLAEFLRYDLGLTGTKIGCNEAECGICTVLVDGTPVNSCIYPALRAEGASVTTIEGLADGSALDPLQQEFIQHGAVQCGFCTPGLIMTARALLNENENPDDESIKHALKDTYCRCTGYTAVIRAIKSAAQIQRTGTPIPPAIPDTDHADLKVVGQSVASQEAIGKVTGTAMYTDDYTFPDMLYARTLRAAYPHARIRSIETTLAKALPGVKAVLTHEDVPGKNRHGLVHLDWPVLADTKVRYMGDPVAIVAAETEAIAAEALKLIVVDYEVLPVVADPEYARTPEAPVLHEEWPTGNLLKHIKVRHGDIDQGFADADVIVEGEYHTPTTEHAFLEPECAIGIPAGTAGHDKLTVYVGSQIPYQDRSQLSAAMNLPETDVRILGTLIGGGFGGKEDIAGQIHVAMLATVTGKPVKMLYTRQESLVFHPKRHATVIRIKTGAKRDGRLTAVQAELYGDGGAYASLSDKVLTRATTHATGPYIVPNAKIDCYAMYTNNPVSGAFRGFGVTQSAFAVEQNMDRLADELGLDPITIRRINAQRVGVVTATGQLLRESVGLLDSLDKVYETMQEVTPSNDHDFHWAWREGTKAYGWGVACAYKNTGLGGGAPDKAGAEVEAFEDGSFEVRTSSADMGQGLVMVVAQCAAEELRVPYDRVRVLLSDTDKTPNGGPTTASRQTYVTGNAARLAAATLRDAMTRVAAETLDAPPERVRFEEGLARYEQHEITVGEIVKQMKRQGLRPASLYEYTAPQTQALGTGGDMHFAFSYATQAALVEVDLETGETKVQTVVGGHDIGRAINPLALQGQIEGGIVMAMGNCLTEAFITENGVPWTRLLSRYKMPSIRHSPEIISHIIEARTADGPYGAKGVGEIASINTTPAIANAITHATGVRVYNLPIDQDALLRAIKSGATEVHSAWQDVK